MSRSVVLPEKIRLDVGFSIGICAADSAANLGRLLELIENETYPSAFTLEKVVLIASGCDPEAMTHVRELADRDGRFLLIEEPTRRGKSAAINQIIENFNGRFLVLVNSDALPESGAISSLLQEIVEDKDIGMVSASPIVAGKPGITSSVLQLMWGTHNECLIRLSDNERNNHCCDELLVVRSEALRKLPPDTVNDGAYLAGNAYQAGYSVKFCELARVKIDVPGSFIDLIRQRRRIVYGHVQIWKSVGESPRTLESMLLGNPLLSLSILIHTLAKSPRLVLALPVALIGEAVSIILAIGDNLSSTKKHTTWDRFGSRS
ncbi:MAG: glycosyltransferase family 2 protein [Candidatus Bathyarchaeia archaeon]|jgi:cellulose synthase/poly-beta-1,6-N-acetylglucosamine synthase-like glycosyltransferase